MFRVPPASAGRWLLAGGLFSALVAMPAPAHAGLGSWTATSTVGAPSARSGHTAVWTGSKMIVWGGGDEVGLLNTGGIYDPVTDTWTATSTTNAPSGRTYQTAVWTGSKMIVWGGWDGSVGYFNSGGIYDPATDGWTATSTTNAPSGRIRHTAVWTGSKMIVWGGYDAFGSNTGGIYDPATDTWTPTSTTNAPSSRANHTALWTGSKMIVWGGEGGVPSGGIYDPATDTWTTPSTTGATWRSAHSAVWTGSKMIVWGGQDEVGGLWPWSNTGGIYDPAADIWTATSTTNAPLGRAAHTAVWTGSRMIVWGGTASDYYPLNSGGIYDPVTDRWTATATTNRPSARLGQTGLWAGSMIVVWGGSGSTGTTPGANGVLNTGGVFDLGGADPGDFDADGQTDILWHNQATGQLYVWLMHGTTQASGLFLAPPSVNPSWQVRGIGDLDGDKRSDLLWHNQSTGQLYAWFMNGTSQASGSFLTPSPVNLAWQVQGLADFNADGKADILWRNRSTGQLYVWFMNGITESSGTFLTPAAVADPAWQIRGLADFDWDGKPDILWHNQATGQLYVWVMDGVTQSWGWFLSPSSVPNLAWQISQVGDFDGDGLADILWRNQSSGALYVWIMDRFWMASGGFVTPSPVSNLSWQVVPPRLR
jgi:FG-GAP-like repeat/FG-GAP repeat